MRSADGDWIGGIDAPQPQCNCLGWNTKISMKSGYTGAKLFISPFADALDMTGKKYCNRVWRVDPNENYPNLAHVFVGKRLHVSDGI
jgi:hypothetical protein